MPQSFAQIYIHIVFSTKYRQPFFQDLEKIHYLYAFIAGLCNKRHCNAIQVGGYIDHVHILCSLSRTKTIADLVKEIKTVSTSWIQTNLSNAKKFHWQDGYGVFSVSQSQLEIVRQYILSQKEHHEKQLFQNEFRKLLINYNIKFDERYVWD
jgi:REP element-mobilizing transposase RayT